MIELTIEELKKLSPTEISPNGWYIDRKNNMAYKLTDADIIELRRYFRKNIASNRVIQSNPSKKASERRKEIHPNLRTRPKHYVLASKQKYNDKKHSIRGRLKTGAIAIALAAMGVTVTFLHYSLFTEAHGIGETDPVPTIEVETTTDDAYDSIIGDEFIIDVSPSSPEIPEEIEAIDNSLEGEEKGEEIEATDNSLGGEEKGEEIPEESANSKAPDLNPELKEDLARKTMIQRYCDVFQVNFDVIYPRLEELTDHFSNENYRNGYIPGVTCKGRTEVYCQSDEELWVYFIRCAKQTPEKLGISTENLYVSNGYTSPEDYGKAVYYYSKLLGVEDPCLMYAIIQTETGWSSDLFQNGNNPAGLRLPDGSWWHFDSKEEGFIEFALELVKYQLKGLRTIPEIGAVHAPTSDGNDYWVSTVTSIYNSILPKQAEIFGITNEDTIQNQR